jgi:ferredoxin
MGDKATSVRTAKTPAASDSVRPTLHWRLHEAIGDSRFMAWLLDPKHSHRFAYIPSLPRWITARMGTEPPVGPRSLEVPELPEELKTAGSVYPVDEVAAQSAFDEMPLPLWTRLNHEINPFIRRKMWAALARTLPSMVRQQRRMATADPRPTAPPSKETDPQALAEALKAKAREVGFSAIGVAAYDQKFAYDPYLGEVDGDRVVVCVLEQNYDATQQIPSTRSERAAINTYTRGIEMGNELAEFLRAQGYLARSGDAQGRVMTIAFAVAAGLGQLGLNGQLLTPFAGSRCRLFALTTNAPLALDRPVDYGIPAVCDACQACVRRCPSGAITSRRATHRGVYKAKIKTERCLPMMAAAEGCAVCMKVCPVQRYGLPAVIEEFKSSGQILGKETDDLEGYTWPVDGVHYGPSDKPKHAVSPEFLHPDGMVFDPKRTRPEMSQDDLAALDARIATGDEVEL